MVMQSGIIVSRYYKENKDVKEDAELQAYLDEVSLDGTGQNGGIGRVNMKTKHQAWLSLHTSQVPIRPELIPVSVP